MTSQILTPELLHRDLIKLNGTRVTISGVLIVDESAHIELTGPDGTVRLPIEDSAFIGRLLDEVPCYLGGAPLYHDPAQVVAIITVKANAIAAISSIESGILTRDGESFNF
jgi:hypothetical protein